MLPLRIGFFCYFSSQSAMSIQFISSEIFLRLLRGGLNQILLTRFAYFSRSELNYCIVFSSAVFLELARHNADAVFPLLSSSPIALKLFIGLLLFRYTRLLVNLVAFWFYTPKAPESSSFSATDATVIVPTVDPAGINFKECIHSIRKSGPALIIIVAAGKAEACRQTNFEIVKQHWEGHFGIRVMECKFTNKRQQICTALPEVSEDCD